MISVAIVTARENEHTSYGRWRSLSQAFLSGKSEWTDPSNESIVVPLGGPNRRLKHLGGEFGALLAACLSDEAEHHVEYQLRALALQTMKPERVFVVSRNPEPEGFCDRWPGVAWEQPMMSVRELDLNPVSSAMFPSLRPCKESLGCTDKNTTLLLCRTDHLIVLDDCCLPGFGMVESALDACMKGHVFFLQHRQMYLPTVDRPGIEIGESNTNLSEGHIAMGIWAAPIKHFLAINGWNTELDGQRGGLDQELKMRLDVFARMKGIEYSSSPYARVYELEHTYPWGSVSRWEPPEIPPGYRAPGPSLSEIRAAVQHELTIEEIEDAEEEEGED